MSHGKIEQVGLPNQIYNFPETEFVARFVGQINLMKVKVIDPSVGMVQLGSQTLRAGQFGRLNGRPMQLAVRPEELNPGFEDGANNLRGRIDSVTYLGSIVRIRVDVDENPLLLDVFNERFLKIPTTGETFDFHFPVNACWLMESGEKGVPA